ncbi:tetratricopeptide repeat protein [Prochlorococcus sp. MIT 0602]|uniref:tetratricopeptide repeat protein n=1 Tax=Prochlorococcus sp. MIT 0602 TaxID=1499499 RepID=UPI000533A24A|nr:tetratricopeptide repeat protein [Prochlorococcus sp. MIT 0602]KGG17189.1 TPR repeat [Prochlorococcus sp. MIT 0603]
MVTGDRLSGDFGITLKQSEQGDGVRRKFSTTSKNMTTSNLKIHTADEYVDRGVAKMNDDVEGAMNDFNKAIEIDPNNALAYYFRGYAKYYELEVYSGAISDYSKAIEIDPSNSNFYTARGFSKQAIKDSIGATNDFFKALEINPRNADAYYGRGIAQQLYNKEGAIEDYSKAIEIDTNHADAYLMRGSAKEVLKKVEGAMEDYSKAIEINENNTRAFYARGALKSSLKDYSGAISDYTKAIEINPEFTKAYLNRGIAKEVLKNKEGSCEDWKKGAELGDQACAHNWKVFCNINKSDFPKIILAKEKLDVIHNLVCDLWELYDSTDRELPEMRYSYSEDGRVNFSYYAKGASEFYTVDSEGIVTTQGGIEIDDINHIPDLFALTKTIICDLTETKPIDFDQSKKLEEYRLLIKNRNNDGNIVEDSDETKKAFSNLVNKVKENFDIYERGKEKEGHGDLEGAIEDYEKALELNPESQFILNSLGVAKIQLGDANGAIECLTKALEIDPRDPLILINLARAKDFIEDYEGAILDIDKALEINENSEYAYWLRGNIKFKTIDFQGAIKDYTTAIDIKPEESRNYFGRGTSNFHLGNYENAISDYNKTIEINPKLCQAYVNRGRCKSFLEDQQGAFTDYQTSIEINPNHGHAYTLIGDYYANISLEGRDLHRAIKYWKKALELGYKDAVKWIVDRAIDKGESEDYEGSIKDLNLALEINPNYPDAYRNMGISKYRSGDVKGACEYWDKGSKLGDPTCIKFYLTALHNN